MQCSPHNTIYIKFIERNHRDQANTDSLTFRDTYDRESLRSAVSLGTIPENVAGQGGELEKSELFKPFWRSLWIDCIRL